MASDPAPLSKTAKYKKITKPLLERKRRARINRCLDELKDLMVGALEIDDDNLSKLEKADILELTVNHLTKLHSPKDPVLEAKKFQAGFGQCAAEACQFIMSVPDLDAKVSQSLISHLSRLIAAQPLTIQVPDRPPFSPPTSPGSVVSDRQHYYSDHDRSSSDAEDSVYSNDSKQWTYSQPNARPARKLTPPMAGLLTTVDKVPSPNYVQEPNGTNAYRNSSYFNRVPVEAKDVILQKIRQHIMDKRGNENASDVNAGTESVAEQKYLYKDDVCRSDLVYPYPVSSGPSSDTLDLRKFRSPLKTSPESMSPKKRFNQTSSQLDTSASDFKIEASNLPERCELTKDYSNLPPKKKRKLIEYQEYKKQEEARRQLESFYAEKKVRDGSDSAPTDDEKWRPW